jgi:hypothetical protein
VGDVTFWEDTHTLPHTLPLEILIRRCTAATLRISNQKNGRRNSTIHHEATNTPTCPVAALARRVNHILHHTNDPHTMLGTFFTSIHKPGRQITPHDISSAVKNTTQTLGLARFNIHPEDVSSHSLRAGGAMAIHLGGASATTIKILGRWSSDTFLLYIHDQLAGFSANLSIARSATSFSHNVAMHPSPRLITDPNNATC